MVFGGEALIFDTEHLGSQSIDTGIGSGFISAVKYEMGLDEITVSAY